MKNKRLKKVNYISFPKATENYFCKYLVHERLASRKTIEAYRDAFISYMKYMAENNQNSPETLTLAALTRQNIVGYMIWLEEKNYAPRTRRLKLAALKSFCSYLTYIDPVHLEQWHEIKELKINIKPKDSIKYITVEAITSLLESIPLDTQKGRRDFALLTIMYYTGARVNEMILMSPADIRISKPYIIKLHGKGDKSRLVPINERAIEILKSYMIENGLDKEIKQNSPLFFNSWGENLTEQGVAYIIDKYVSNMKNIRPDLFNVRVTPHTFRHSRAMHLLQSGVNLIYIRDLLGHVSIQTTEIYARADERAKREAIEKASEKIMPQLSPIENSWKKDKGLMEFLRSL